MTTSAYNLGNAGLASKILRIKDLMRMAGVEGFPVLGIEVVGFSFSDIGGRLRSPGVGVRPEFLVERWGMSQFGSFEILSKGYPSHKMGNLLRRAVEKDGE